MAIDIIELTGIANSRLEEAEFLFSKEKYDVATYLAGYAIELTLKVRICKTLNWSEFPLPIASSRDINLTRLKHITSQIYFTYLELRMTF